MPQYIIQLTHVLKKQGQELQVVQDFHELNNHSHIYKYLIKEITE